MKNLTLKGWRQVSRLAICSFISLRNRSRRAVLTACCEQRDRRLLPPAQPALWVSPRRQGLPASARKCTSEAGVLDGTGVLGALRDGDLLALHPALCLLGVRGGVSPA